MTIAGATRLARVRQSAADSTTSTFVADTDTRDSVLGKVAAFIPTEIVTAWAAALGVISPTAEWQRWLIFGVAIAVLLLVGVLDFALKDKRDKEADPNSRAVSTNRKMKTLLVLGVAFAAWALASPGSPLTTVGMRVAFGCALALSLVLPKVAELWDISPAQ